MSVDSLLKRDHWQLKRMAILFASMSLGLVLTVQAASAATINVNTTKDEYNTSGSGNGCSLREAIQAANTNAAFGGCTAGAVAGTDLIKLGANLNSADKTYKITIPPGSSDNSAGDFNISSSLTIEGPDDLVPVDLVTISGNGLDRVFDIAGSQGANLQVKFDHLHITGGTLSQQNGAAINHISPGGTLTIEECVIANNIIDGSGNGAAVANTNGTVNINDSIITLNIAKQGNGGGIFNTGNTSTVNLDSVSVLGNISKNSGGGIHNAGSGKLNVDHSTIAFNVSRDESGGGLYLGGANSTATFTNSTVSTNFTSVNGGGMFSSQGTLTLKNVTVTGNHADSDAAITSALNAAFGQVPDEIKEPVVDFVSSQAGLPNANNQGDGGGIGNVGGIVKFDNTIIAGNKDDSASTIKPDVYCNDTNAFTSQNYNLVGSSDGCTFMPGDHDMVGTNAALKSADLIPLQLNGADFPLGLVTMFTHRPDQNGSDYVVDMGNNCTGSTDQRGFPRIDALSGACDKGAFEVEVVDDNSGSGGSSGGLNGGFGFDLGLGGSGGSSGGGIIDIVPIDLGNTNDIPIFVINDNVVDINGDNAWVDTFDPGLILDLFSPDIFINDGLIGLGGDNTGDGSDNTGDGTVDNTGDGTDSTGDGTSDGTDSTSSTTSGGNYPVDERCAGYSDLHKDDTDCDAFEYMQEVGAITGYAGTTKVGADDLLQRDQMLKVATIMNQQTEKFDVFKNTLDYCKDMTGADEPFSDVSSADWVFQYACYGKDKIVFGYSSGVNKGKFIPGGTLTRPEFLAMAFRILNEIMPTPTVKSYDDVEITSENEWLSGLAEYAKKQGIFPGKNLYLTKAVKRRDVARGFFILHGHGKLHTDLGNNVQ